MVIDPAPVHFSQAARPLATWEYLMLLADKLVGRIDCRQLRIVHFHRRIGRGHAYGRALRTGCDQRSYIPREANRRHSCRNQRLSRGLDRLRRIGLIVDRGQHLLLELAFPHSPR